MTKKSKIYEIYLFFKWVICIYISWICQYLLDNIKQRCDKEPINIELLAQSIREQPKGSRIKILRNERSSPSNSIHRPLSLLTTEDIRMKKTNIHFVNLGAANKILTIDTSSKTVTCEPGVTIEQLIDNLVPYNLIPAVVPEFKFLTVGGLLAGAGLESSSFRYGQFGDLLVEATYILSNGQIITCSPTKDSDLFYGALGSCGTFGLLINATLRVIDAKSDCFVRCNYVRTTNPIDCLLSVYDEDYVDAIVFSNYAIIITGKRINKEFLPKTAKIQTFSKAWDPWYYQHVKTIYDKNDLTVITEYVPLKDYLFRYDRGAFWMGRYILNPFQDYIQHFPLFWRNLINFLPFGGYNIISRTLLSPLFTTSSLYKRLHDSSISVVADGILIQDIYIPKSKAKEFLSFVQSKQLFTDNNSVIEPIWLCPIRAIHTPQKFSPHFVNKTTKDDDSLFINFGLWFHQQNWQPGSSSNARSATRVLEGKAKNLRGRKMLYSLSYYSRKEWSNIYEIEWYEEMKRKWDPEYAWGDLYNKIIEIAVE